MGATTGVVAASWFGSYKGTGPQWVNQDITINGKYYAGVDGPVSPAVNGDGSRTQPQPQPQFTAKAFP